MGVRVLAGAVVDGVVAAVTAEQHAATIRAAIEVTASAHERWNAVQALDTFVALAVAAEERASQLEHERDEANESYRQVADEWLAATRRANHLEDNLVALLAGEPLPHPLDRMGDPGDAPSTQEKLSGGLPFGDGQSHSDFIIANVSNLLTRLETATAELEQARAALAGVQAKDEA